MSSTEARTCTKCGELYPLECFHRYRRDQPRRRARCKFCLNTDRNRGYLEHPDRWEHRLERERRRWRQDGQRRYAQGVERETVGREMHRIVRELTRAGLTVNAIASGAGISRCTVIDWKHGRIRKPNRAGVLKLRTFYRQWIERGAVPISNRRTTLYG